MKKCPFCKAEIEDNARFCLYCMKPLNEKENISSPPKKKPWWLLIVAGVLFAAVLAVVLFVLGQKPEQPAADASGESLSNMQATEPQSTESMTGKETQPDEAVYTYREARARDDFNIHYQNSGNDIVITGMEQLSADGIYDIPAYIDGKKVIAITANAFTGTNARVVYVPSTVKTIWNYAFAGCSLTDIYFRGNSIYTQNLAFSGSVTIHCSATCSDRNLRYYKNSAPNYGAIWEEWNG